jgi:hypothetical protein
MRGEGRQEVVGEVRSERRISRNLSRFWCSCNPAGNAMQTLAASLPILFARTSSSSATCISEIVIIIRDEWTASPSRRSGAVQLQTCRWRTSVAELIYEPYRVKKRLTARMRKHPVRKLPYVSFKNRLVIFGPDARTMGRQISYLRTECGCRDLGNNRFKK